MRKLTGAFRDNASALRKAKFPLSAPAKKARKGIRSVAPLILNLGARHFPLKYFSGVF